MLILKKILKPLKKQKIRMKEKNNDQNSFWRCTCFRYGGLHVPPNVSVSEVIYALEFFYNFICRIPSFKIL